MGLNHPQQNMAKAKGFTLIELVIIVAILGVLASIPLREYQEQQVKAQGKTTSDATLVAPQKDSTSIFGSKCTSMCEE